MLNAEKYREEVLRCALFGKVKANLESCFNIDCELCEFYTGEAKCNENRVKWLLSEYIPKPTRAEKFMEFIKGTEYEEVFEVDVVGTVRATRPRDLIDWWNAESEEE